MHVISMKKLREFWSQHPDAEAPLRSWHKIAKHEAWRQFAEVRSFFPHADPVGRLTVFNIGGNKYRLVVHIIYECQEVYVKHVLTHREYDRGGWKSG